MDAFAGADVFKAVDAGNRRLLRLERATAGGDDDGLGADDGLLVGGDLPQAGVIFALRDLAHGHGHFAQMVLGAEGMDLFQQAHGQVVAGDDRPCRDVVDRLFRIEFRALTADLVENVDQMAFDIEQPQFEDAEQAYWAGTDNDDISRPGLAGFQRFHVV